MIPFDQWKPLSIDQTVRLFTSAPFQWCLAGGHAVEQFVGRSLRPHGDIDALIFRDDQLAVQRWLGNWQLYAADPPGALRTWMAGEALTSGIHDIWGHRPDSVAWELQIMLAETEGDQWYSRHNSLIRGQRGDLMTIYNELPCIRIEVQLLYKARSLRPQDEADFKACLPLLSEDARSWLRNALQLMHSNGHAWLTAL